MRGIACIVALAAVVLTSGNAAAQPVSSDPVRVLITGDVSFGENYQADAARRGQPNLLVERGYDYPLARLAPILRRADYTVINLETPLTALPNSPLADSGKDYLHWSDPDKTTAALVAYGVDAAGLANNHTLDFGVPGLSDTLRALKRHGIAAFGAGRDGAEAAEPLIRTFRIGSRDVTVAVIASFERRASYERYKFYASSTEPGTNPINVGTLRTTIADLRRRHPGVFVISYPHWGANYAWRSTDQQKLAQAMIDAGADLVVGHHGHMLQEIERYGGKWIVYGLGNFMFNSAGRFAAFPHAVPFGLALELVFSGPEHAEARLYPIPSDNLTIAYQPRVANGADANRAFGELLRRSALGADEGLVGRDHDDIGPYLVLPQALPPSR